MRDVIAYPAGEVSLVAYAAGAIFNFQISLIDPMVKNYAFAYPAGSHFFYSHKRSDQENASP